MNSEQGILSAAQVSVATTRLWHGELFTFQAFL